MRSLWARIKRQPWLPFCSVAPRNIGGAPGCAPCDGRPWRRWQGRRRWYQFTGLMRHEGAPRYSKIFPQPSHRPCVSFKGLLFIYLSACSFLIITLPGVLHPHLPGSFRHRSCAPHRSLMCSQNWTRMLCKTPWKGGEEVAKEEAKSLCCARGSRVYFMITCYLHSPSECLCDDNTL